MGMNFVFQEALGWLVPTLLGAVVGWFVRRSGDRARRKQFELLEEKAIREGIVALLRSELMNAYEAYVVRGDEADAMAVECLERTYSCYHKLGANDIGTRIYESIMTRAMSPGDDVPEQCSLDVLDAPREGRRE